MGKLGPGVLWYVLNLHVKKPLPVVGHAEGGTQQGMGANRGRLCLGQENVIPKSRELGQGSTLRHFLKLSTNAIVDKVFGQ